MFLWKISAVERNIICEIIKIFSYNDDWYGLSLENYYFNDYNKKDICQRFKSLKYWLITIMSLFQIFSLTTLFQACQSR